MLIIQQFFVSSHRFRLIATTSVADPLLWQGVILLITMTFKELCEIRKRLYDQYREAVVAAEREYALGISPYKKGDVIELKQGGYIAVMEIKVVTIGADPEPVYIGFDTDKYGRRKQAAKKRKVHMVAVKTTPTSIHL